MNSLRLLAFVLLVLLPHPAAASWPSDPTTNVPLCLATGHQSTPRSTSDGKGGAIVVWDDQRGGGYDVYMQRVDATGAAKWAANGVVITAAANSQTQPRVLADGSGGAFLTWTDERALAGYGRIYVQHVNSSGAALWTAGGVVTNNSTSGENYPWIVSNGAGGLVVAWQDIRSGDIDIYVQRILSTGAIDPAWPIGGRQVTSLHLEQNIGGMLPDGNGGALLTWAQWEGGSHDIYVHHVLLTGGFDPSWPADGRKVSSDNYEQSSPGIVSDGAGGALVSYFDYHGTRSVRARRVLASGALDAAWPDTGLVLCATLSEKLFAVPVLSDTAAIVVWMDQGDGTWNLYGQKFLRTGVVDPSWPVDGRAITTANKNQGSHSVTPDGAGGAIVAWSDNRTEAGMYGDDGEIFAQGIRGNGLLGDPPVGVPGDPSFEFALRMSNPVRAGAMIVRFTLPGSAPASLAVFNVAGRRVAGREVSGAGAHAIDLGAGWHAVPGVYFVRLSQGRLESTRRIVLLD